MCLRTSAGGLADGLDATNIYICYVCVRVILYFLRKENAFTQWVPVTFAFTHQRCAIAANLGAQTEMGGEKLLSGGHEEYPTQGDFSSQGQPRSRE